MIHGPDPGHRHDRLCHLSSRVLPQPFTASCSLSSAGLTGAGWSGSTVQFLGTSTAAQHPRAAGAQRAVYPPPRDSRECPSRTRAHCGLLRTLFRVEKVAKAASGRKQLAL